MRNHDILYRGVEKIKKELGKYAFAVFIRKIVYFCLAGLLFAGTNVLVALGYKSEMISTTKFLNVHPAIWVLLCIALFLFIKGKKPF